MQAGTDPDANTESKPPSIEWPDKELSALANRLKTAKSISADVDKDVVLSLMGKTKNYKGSLKAKGNLFLMDLQGEERTVFTVNGTTLWVTSYPPADIETDIQVLRVNLNKDSGTDRFLFDVLAGTLDWKKHFELTEVSDQNQSDVRISMKPKAFYQDFVRLDLNLKKETGEMTGLTYWDELDNETAYRFKNFVYDAELKNEIFSFKQPPNSKLTVAP